MAPLCSSWMWKVLPRCARQITSRRFRKQIIAWRKDYGRTAIRFVLIVTVAVFAAANVVASKRQSAAGPDYSPMRVARKRRSSGWLTASCSPTWHNVNAWAVATDGPDLLIWERIVAVSLHGHRYFFSYGTATDGGAPFTRETLLEIGSCTKTFTTTLFALAINRNQIVPDASARKYMPSGYTLRAQQLTPLELADFTSGMWDDPTDLPRAVQPRSIEYYTMKDFLAWASN